MTSLGNEVFLTTLYAEAVGHVNRRTSKVICDELDVRLVRAPRSTFEEAFHGVFHSALTGACLSIEHSRLALWHQPFTPPALVLTPFECAQHYQVLTREASGRPSEWRHFISEANGLVFDLSVAAGGRRVMTIGDDQLTEVRTTLLDQTEMARKFHQYLSWDEY